MKRVILTGWAGFIGSNLTRLLFKRGVEVWGIDAMTYAARPDWAVDPLVKREDFHRLTLDLAHGGAVRELRDSILRIKPDAILHLAAESHVCRSIEGPRKFLESNVVGTFNLLEAARLSDFKGVFHHVSTDEVFGELQLLSGVRFDEQTAYAPRSPYAATKAASDHLVRAWHHTYGLDVRITNCSNNFGPNQHEEKLIPKAIMAILRGETVTVYGSGQQVRDWIFVEDHCRGILDALEKGLPGETYLLGGECERSNLEVIAALEHVLSRKAIIEHTNDRPHDDQRYAINCSRARRELGWAPVPDLFMSRLARTAEWYKARMKNV